MTQLELVFPVRPARPTAMECLQALLAHWERERERERVIRQQFEAAGGRRLPQSEQLRLTERLMREYRSHR